MELRPARIEDEAGLRALDAATWSPRVSPGPPPDLEREFLSRFGIENVIVAAEGEVPVGFITLGTWTPLESARHVLVFNGLAVDPARQGEGIGGRLLEAGVERARERGARRLLLRVLSTNESARRLYERHGFTLEASLRGVFHLDGADVDDDFMGLDLAR